MYENKLKMAERLNYKTRHTIIKMEKFKDKERILKAARKKQRLNYKKTLHKVIS